MLEATAISLEELLQVTQKMFDEDWRLVTQTVVDLGDEGFEIFYHYDKELEMTHYKLVAPKGRPVPSISGIYFCAMLVENENRDLFGIEYDGLVLDFNRTLYLENAGDSINAPFCKITTYSNPKSEG